MNLIVNTKTAKQRRITKALIKRMQACGIPLIYYSDNGSGQTAQITVARLLRGGI